MSYFEIDFALLVTIQVVDMMWVYSVHDHDRCVSGITIIEFAQIDPPYSKMNPARVAIKILHSDPPTLNQPKKW